MNLIGDENIKEKFYTDPSNQASIEVEWSLISNNGVKIC